MSSQSPQSQENDRLLEICKNVSTEKDSGKLTRLIRELNQELDERHSRKPLEAALGAHASNAAHGE